MITKWSRRVLLLSVLLISIGAGAVGNELSFQKNRAKRNDAAKALSTTIPALTPGQVYGTHPFFAKLSVKVYAKNEGVYQEILTPIANLKPGMILDLPLYESQARMDERANNSNELLMPSEADNYYWSDWDKGDRDIDQDNSDLTWFVLTLKDEFKAPNVAKCSLLGSQTSTKIVTFNANDSDSKRWEQLELAAKNAGDLLKNNQSEDNILQNNANTPWNSCFTAIEITKVDINRPNLSAIRNSITKHAIEIPMLEAHQRIGFAITPDSLLGFPQKGYQAYVWDISQIWAQQIPEKTENVVSAQDDTTGENKFADINVVFPEFESIAGINKDMSLPIGPHPIIESPKVVPFDGEYRIRIFDKEYYDLNKQNLDSSYDLTRLEKNFPEVPFKGFYTNRQYVAIVEILDKNTFRVRSLTKEEVEDAEQNILWQLEWEDTNERFSENNLIEMNKPYSITYKYVDEKLETDPKVEIVYKLDAQNMSSDEVEYIQFNAQVNNEARIGSIVEGKKNPENGEQSFRATVGFKYKESLDISGISTYEVDSIDEFISQDE